MTRNRRGPFSFFLNEASQLQEDFNRLFGRFAPFSTQAGGAVPLVNLWEDENSLFAEADLPGLDPATLDVFVTEGNQLTVQGERKAPEVKGSAWVRQERPFGRFTRVIGLPSLVDADKVEASYEAGVLRLKLPKSEAARPRKINVKAGE
jgi:HSP20 family protein